MIMTDKYYNKDLPAFITCFDDSNVQGWGYTLSNKTVSELLLNSFPKQVKWSVYEGIFYEYLIVGALLNSTLYFETNLRDPHGAWSCSLVTAKEKLHWHDWNLKDVIKQVVDSKSVQYVKPFTKSIKC